MNNYAHYRIVPVPNVKQKALDEALSKLKVPLTRVTRDVSGQLIKSCDNDVTSFVWKAFVDAMNDRYTFPSASEIQSQLDGKAVVVNREVFCDPETKEPKKD